MHKKTEERLRTPEAAYRAKPFWSWNGELEESELLRQIDAMQEMGFGGFFMHSRTGLATEYLGEEWFRLIRRCAEYAAEKGMEAWIYDEDRWPSGTCGGLVTRNRAFRMRFISEYESDRAALACPDVDKILCRYAVKLCEGELCDALPVQSEKEVPEGYNYLVYAEELFHPGDFYNGEAYLNTMDPEAVQAFLHSTLDLYAEKCGDLLGTKIPGVFTDEPHRGALLNGFGITNANRERMAPYTAALPSAYLKKYGNELCIPEIYYRRKGEKENRTAARYIDVLDDLFTQSYARLYAEKCRQLGLAMTGHILHEDNLSIQTSLSGSMMRFYEYMDIPGMDNLGIRNSCVWAAVQCASVARQMGKKFVLSELYGCTGWDMPLSEYKRIGDWHALFGINLRCPHLSWYTMKGEAKRDYPASILHQNAWYRDWKPLETYFGRIGILLTEGERRADILVIHPVENMWKLVRRGWMQIFTPQDEAIAALDQSFIGQCRELIAAQHEFDYGDEELLSRYAQAGKDAQGAFLRVGKAVYRRVLLSRGQAVRESTRQLLEKFRAFGGQIAEEVPQLGEGGICSAPKNVASAVRRLDGDTWLFLLNLSDTESARGAVTLPSALPPYAEEWDMVEFASMGGCALDDLSFAPGQMRIFRLHSRKYPAIRTQCTVRCALPEKMPYTLHEPNVLVLDTAVLTVDDVPPENAKPCDILLTDRALRKKFGLPFRGGEMVQPWYAAKYRGADPVLAKVRIEYSFDSSLDCSALVAAEYDSLYCNGEKAKQEEGRWVDACFRLYRIRIRRGKNVLTVPLEFRQSDNLEAVYLLGQFAVQLPRSIRPLPDLLSPEELTAQGLPFYSGALTFHTGLRKKRVRVRATKLDGTSLHIGDGKSEKIIAYSPYEAETDLDGELELTAYFTRRNTFGPHHLIPQPQDGYGPDSFVTEGDQRTEDYVLVPQGFHAEVYRPDEK